MPGNHSFEWATIHSEQSQTDASALSVPNPANVRQLPVRSAMVGSLTEPYAQRVLGSTGDCQPCADKIGMSNARIRAIGLG